MDDQTNRERVYTVFFPFCGIGGGAVGFAQARAQMAKLGLRGRFEILGGFDLDEGAARDFETLTGAPCLVADVRELTPERLRAFCGGRRPDVIFDSSPCCGASGLLSNEMAETEKYREMNELLLVWTRLMLATWGDDLPLLNIKENVPRLATRAKDVLQDAVKLLQGAGYAVHAGNHNCGELGGLAQNRVRFLMVARHMKKVPSLLYQPPRQRVRGCGEVIGPLPLPNDPAGGPMHELPDICMTNWIRLALIPPGGDWRDIDGALQAHEKRHEHWSRYAVARFDLATVTVTGSGTNGAWGVADERVEAEVRKVAHDPNAHRNKYTLTGWCAQVGTIIGALQIGSGAPSIEDARVPNAYPFMYGVLPWQRPSVTITGRPHLSNGMFSVADVRVPPGTFKGKHEIMAWAEPSRTVIGGPGNGAENIEDVRVVSAFRGGYGLLRWEHPVGTVTGAEGPSTGRFSVADHRVTSAIRGGSYSFTNELMLFGWTLPARTITGATHIGNGVPSLDDVRVPPSNFHSYGVLAFDTPSHTITGNFAPGGGHFSVADARLTCDVRETSGAYGVLDWWCPAYTITAWGDLNNGRFAVADVRPLVRAPELDEAAPRAESPAPKGRRGRAGGRRREARRGALGTRVRSRGGRWNLLHGLPVVADTRIPGNPSLPVLCFVTRLNRPPPFVPVLATESGAWHRPLTIWERFALQGFPLYGPDGRAFVLSGEDVTEWSRRIGNAVPPPAACAIAEQMLITLLCAEAGVFVLSTGGGAWVRGRPAPEWMRVLGVFDLYPRVEEERCGSFAPVEEDDPWASLVGVSAHLGGTLQ